MIQKREVYYFKIAEEWANTKFEIGDGYGILKVYAEDIREVIDMTGYYYINEDGAKVTTDNQFWTIEEIKQKKFYYQNDNKEVNWVGIDLDLYFPYWDGHNWQRIWLYCAELEAGDVEDLTEKIGKLKIIGRNEEQTYNEYAYVSDNGKYYYKYSSFFVGNLDFLEETNFQTIKSMFSDIQLECIEAI